MRQLSTATLAAAVALAFAGAAQAATATTSSTGSTFVARVPTVSSTSTTSNTPTMTRAPTTTVDVRAQQTATATAATHASGSTSALGSLAGKDTSQIGAFNRNAPAGSVATVPGSFFTNPSDSTNGGVATDTTTTTSTTFAGNEIVGGASVLDSTVATNATTQPNGASVDRAIREVAKERRRIGRNGQLLNTIAPRTNGVDRSREMPDDPLPPSLTGMNSTLVR